MIRVAAVLALVALAATACGSTRHAAATATTTTAASTATHCTDAKTVRAEAKLTKDVTALRQAAKLPTTDTLKGNHAINVATDTFLNDVELARIDNKSRNRWIDHAMGTLNGRCEQCFQALEAERPVVTIRTDPKSCS